MWRTRPWNGQTKSLQQTLYDKGYALAALFEDFDSLRSSSTSHPRFEHLIASLHRCTALNSDFEAWYELLLRENPGPLYWPAPSVVLNPKREDQELFPAIKFPTYYMAHLHMTFWALRIILGATITSILNALPPCLTASASTSPPHDSPIPEPLSTPHSNPLHEAQIRAQHSKHSRAQRLNLASKIMQSVPYCTLDSLGLLGAQKCIFPLRTAMAAFEMPPSDARSLARCYEVYNELFSARKLRFARDLARDRAVDVTLRG